MGFGSGGGGFTPSPNNVPGSTTAGTDKDTDTHQFTGSVDITGSLTLNGSSVSGGGGGAVSSYTNSGDNRVITSVNSNTINGEANFTYDGTTMEVVGTSTQAKFSYDSDSFATLTVADDSDVTLATGENGNITLHAGPSGDIFLVADGGQVNFQNPLGQNKLAIDVENAGGLAYISNVKNNDLIFRVGTNVKEVFRLDQSEGALLMSGNFAEPGGFAPIHFRDTATKIHSPGSNRLAITAPTLEVTGTLGLNGTSLTSTADELNLLDAGATQHTASVLAAIPKLAKATYDFAEFTGVADTYTLTGVTLPDNAMIVGGWVDTETNPVDASGSPTVAFGMTAGGQTTMFLGATAIAEFAASAGGPLIPTNQTTPSNYFKLASATTITCTIAGGNLSAGKLHIYLQYVVGA
jgi:hypothetical protein